MRYSLLAIARSLIAGTLLVSTVGIADGPITGFSRGIDHSARGTIASGGASVQATAAVLAVPFVVVGKATRVSTDIGGSLWEFANEPLPVSEESASTQGQTTRAAVVSPDRALQGD